MQGHSLSVLFFDELKEDTCVGAQTDNMVFSCHYGKVRKTSDERYYLRAYDDANEDRSVYVQVNGVTFETPLSDTTVTVKVPARAAGQFVELDKFNVDTAKSKCKEWFTENISIRALRNAYMPSLVEGALNATKATANRAVATRVLTHSGQFVENGISQVVENTTCDVIKK